MTEARLFTLDDAFNNDVDLDLAVMAQDVPGARRRCSAWLRQRAGKRRLLLAYAGLRGAELDAAAPSPWRKS